MMATAGLVGCTRPAPAARVGAPKNSGAASAAVPAIPGGPSDRVLANRFAYVPPQCYAKVQEASGAVHNPCYACHMHPRAPNALDDSDLQTTWQFPGNAAHNPWANLFDPPAARQPRESDEAIRAYVRRSNYFDADGRLALRTRLAALPAAWDVDNDHRWDGYTPDAYFHFDQRGFDQGPDGPTGWRAFAYYPFLGAFLPTNGSADDVLIRLDRPFRENAAGEFDPLVYQINLAVVEALINRADVAVDPVDERVLGVDLDLNGALATATRVAFDGDAGGHTRMHYVGRAQQSERSIDNPIAPGLFPLGTEFLHSVRYLDGTADGTVTMAARMKELRYARKKRWFSYADLKASAAADAVETTESTTGAREVLWQNDHGITNKQGWYFQGFIEAADGSLRPQSYEETVACAGCHGGIGATTDSIFSFARKLPASALARGWFHWTQHDLRGLPEPRRADGEYEYTTYLRENGAADDFRDNKEAQARFFDAAGQLRADAVAALHKDVATLLVPSPARALELDRGYRAIVVEQTFTHGRDVPAAASANVYADAPGGKPTGIRAPFAGPHQPRPVAPPPVSGHSGRGGVPRSGCCRQYRHRN